MFWWILLFFLILAIIGYIGDGLAWLYIHERIYLIGGAAVIVLIIAFFFWAILEGSNEAPVGPKQVARVREAEQTLRRATAKLRQEAASLEQLRLDVSGEVHFELLRQRHYQSMRIADQWYVHVSDARKVRRSVGDGLNKLHRRTGADVTGAVRAAISSLDREIARGRQGLDDYNAQTGKLRDHIRDTCGLKGRQWYNRLEARKAKTIGN